MNVKCKLAVNRIALQFRDFHQVIEKIGGLYRDRTYDPLIKSPRTSPEFIEFFCKPEGNSPHKNSMGYGQIVNRSALVWGTPDHRPKRPIFSTNYNFTNRARGSFRGSFDHGTDSCALFHGRK